MPGLRCTMLALLAAAPARGVHLSDSGSTSPDELMGFGIASDGRVESTDARFSMPEAMEAEEREEEMAGEGQEFNTSKTRVLLVDVRGPTSTTGDGMRTMGMLMDLKSKQCRHQVEVLSDISPHELKSSWVDSVAAKKFSGVHLWDVKEYKGHAMDIAHFHRIIIGAKLELLYEDEKSGVAVPSVISELQHRNLDRKKIAVYWDDVPFDRCHFKPEADLICGRVDKHVRNLAAIAHKFYVLSRDDKERMTRHMKERGLWRGDIVVNVWPMRIRNMWELSPWERFSYSDYENKNLVTMMGNHHAVNTKMVNFLFEKGITGKICQQIKRHDSPVKLLFMGGLAEDAKKAHDHQLGKTDMSCVQVLTEFVPDSTLKNRITPKTRAVLNPFFENINSGISVKNYESVMMGVPFVTSHYGMHGLADEFKPCTWYPMPKDPEDPEQFVNFFTRNVISREGYKEFVGKFHSISPQCAHAQHINYPQREQCW